jgi:hypothetical protein
MGLLETNQGLELEEELEEVGCKFLSYPNMVIYTEHEIK